MNYYTVIPTNILTSEALTSNEKVVYGIVVALTNKDGYCDSTNDEFTNYFGDLKTKPHPKTISRWVNNLVNKGFLVSETVSEEGSTRRRLWIHEKVVVDNTVYVEKPKQESKEPFGGNEELIKEVIDYLNSLTGKNFRYETQAYIKEINGRIREGNYTANDFKKVIEVKCLDDYYIKNPQYFAPTTLFAKSKFDRNLQSWDKSIRDILYTNGAIDEDLKVKEQDLELGEEEY